MILAIKLGQLFDLLFKTQFNPFGHMVDWGLLVVNDTNKFVHVLNLLFIDLLRVISVLKSKLKNYEISICILNIVYKRLMASPSLFWVCMEGCKT